MWCKSIVWCIVIGWCTVIVYCIGGVVQWGVGDQFNPTNTLNAENLEDPTKFGEQLPNTMIRADYALSHMWTVSGVFVPIFRPAALPESAASTRQRSTRLPLSTTRLFSPVATTQLRHGGSSHETAPAARVWQCARPCWHDGSGVAQRLPHSFRRCI